MKYTQQSVSCVAAAMLLAFAVSHCGVASAAVAIPGLYNTGVDSSPGNDQDDNYRITSSSATALPVTSPATAPAYVYDAAEVALVNGTSPPGVYPGSWVNNTATSKWIGPSANILAPTDLPAPSPWAGFFDYTLTFDMSGLVPGSAVITGFWASDNGSQIFLNDQLKATKSGNGFSAFDSFSLTGDFLPGINTLTFRVQNVNAGLQYNPSGLQVNGIEGFATATPEPTTLVVWSGLAAMGGIVAYRRKNRA